MAPAERHRFQGIFLDGRSSRPTPVLCAVGRSEVVVYDEEHRVLVRADLVDCVFTAPLANSRRFLKFPGGQRLQVDAPQVAAFLDGRIRSHGGLRLVHRLESKRRLVAVSLVGLLVFVWAFMAYGIPALAKHLAMATPMALMEQISADSLELLDQRFFAESELDPARQQEIATIFADLSRDLPVHSSRLLFRKGGTIGANAFALPSGTIVVTDELVELARSNMELQGVLAHELIHVRERHGLRHVIQQTGVFMLISTLLGDMTSLTSLGSTLPMVLIESGYSRKFEQEADLLAGRYFLERGQSLAPYAELLRRLTKDDKLPAAASFLASHPNPQQRLQALAELEQSYGQ
ncbi:MAG: peptidase M48 [Desulfobulbaceae bacterium]|nr:MAG: peptidase M48 [Desulfobulbaceae bacterium]